MTSLVRGDIFLEQRTATVREFDFDINLAHIAGSEMNDRLLAGAVSIADTDLARADARCNVATARKAIVAVNDDLLTQPWSLLMAGTPLFTLPRATMMRKFVLNHLIHHRAILCVSLRLNDIPVPGLYDPTGDE